MQLLALGLNHTTAPLAVRERVAFSPDEITDTIAHLLERCGAASQGGIHEAAVLSTCNRTELYTACEDPAAARASVLSYIANKKGFRSRNSNRISTLSNRKKLPATLSASPRALIRWCLAKLRSSAK